MITLFDERDLVSFGMYMISDYRKESIKNNPEITNNQTRKELLKTVTQYDFNNWLALKMKSEREEQENLSEEGQQFVDKLNLQGDPEEDIKEDGEVDEDKDDNEEDNSKIIKMTPNK